jgi:hypothetical protein
MLALCAADAASGGQTLAQDANAVPLLPAADRARLKNQSFVRPERIKEVLESVQSVLMQRVPDLKAVMKVSAWWQACVYVWCVGGCCLLYDLRGIISPVCGITVCGSIYPSFNIVCCTFSFVPGIRAVHVHLTYLNAPQHAIRSCTSRTAWRAPSC